MALLAGAEADARVVRDGGEHVRRRRLAVHLRQLARQHECTAFKPGCVLRCKGVPQRHGRRLELGSWHHRNQLVGAFLGRVDARVDQRAGGRVLRLCAKSESAYDVDLGDASLSGEFAFRAPRASLSIVLDDAEGKARREALFGQVKRVDLSCRSALDASGKHGAALDLTVGDVRVESHARNARLRVVLERDDQNDDDVLHASLARQRDGAAEVWRYAGLHVAPLAVALDRATLAALFDTYSSIVSLALGKQDDASVKTWARNLTDRDLRKRTGDAASLFKAFSKEPKLFVDAVELDPTEVRCTLALAATMRTIGR